MEVGWRKNALGMDSKAALKSVSVHWSNFNATKNKNHKKLVITSLCEASVFYISPEDFYPASDLQLSYPFLCRTVIPSLQGMPIILTLGTGQLYYPINWWQWLDKGRAYEQVSQPETFPGILNTSKEGLGTRSSLFSLDLLSWDDLVLFEIIACSMSMTEASIW